MTNGLGRGLGSLIPNKKNPHVVNLKADGGSGGTGSNTGSLGDSNKDKVLKVSINDIEANPMQPRKSFTDANMEELINSVREHGIIQPLVVSPGVAEQGVRKYELIAGERRLRAARKAGLDKVPIIVREAGAQEKLEVALIENIQRENLNPIDMAVAFKRLIDEFSLTQEEVARQVGKSRSSVTNILRLLSLPEEIKEALVEGKISEGHAKYLVGLDSEVKQMSLFRKIIHNKLTVGDTGKEARRMGGTKHARIKINYADKDKEFALREFFGTRVEIKRKGKGGQIIVDFFSDDELGEIIGKVKK